MTVWIVSHHWGFDGGSCVDKVFAFESQAMEYILTKESQSNDHWEVEEHAVLAM